MLDVRPTGLGLFLAPHTLSPGKCLSNSNRLEVLCPQMRSFNLPERVVAAGDSRGNPADPTVEESTKGAEGWELRVEGRARLKPLIQRRPETRLKRILRSGAVQTPDHQRGIPQLRPPPLGHRAPFSRQGISDLRRQARQTGRRSRPGSENLTRVPLLKGCPPGHEGFGQASNPAKRCRRQLDAAVNAARVSFLKSRMDMVACSNELGFYRRHTQRVDERYLPDLA